MAPTPTPAANQRQFRHVRNQFLAVLIVNVIALSHGLTIGWVSPALLLLSGRTASKSPLHDGALSVEMMSWIGCVSNVGGLLGNFFYSWLSRRFGRRWAFICMAVPNIIWWISIFFIKNAVYLILFRVISGLTGGGTLVCIPSFVAEIASDEVRGTLGALLAIFLTIGIFIAYIAGTFLPYNVVPGALVVFPVLFMSSAIFLPETPRYLITHGRLELAEKSLRFYSNCTDDTAEDRQRYAAELAKLQAYAKRHFDAATSNRAQCRDYCTPEARHGIVIALAMITLYVFSGGIVLLTYASTIFTSSGSTVHSSTASLIMIAVLLCGTIVAAFLVDCVGRQALMIASTAGTALGMASMAAFVYLHSRGRDVTPFHWVPVASASMALFAASIGIMPLLFVVVAEVLPAAIRETGLTWCLAGISSNMLLIAKVYPIAAGALGMYTCFGLFAAVCVLGVLFSVFVLKETKGTSINDNETLTTQTDI